MKHFKVKELVPSEVYAERGEKAITTICPLIIKFIDGFHDWLSSVNQGSKVSIIVNNGTTFTQRGLRTPDSDDYSEYSQHSFGRAVDFDVYIDGDRQHPDSIHTLIIEFRNMDFTRGITFIETGINWVHVDTRYREDGGLVEWNVRTGESVIHSRT